MTNAFSKTMRIQILLSVLLILFGVMGIYMMHRARSESTQVASYEREEGEERREGGEEGREEREGHFSSLPPLPSSPFPHESMVGRLEKLKYDGYMRVGDMKLAWLSDGKDRIMVGEGGVLDDTIRIDEIHENFLLASLINQATTSAVGGRIVREIPFTRSPGDSGMGGRFGAKEQGDFLGLEDKEIRGQGESSHPSSLLPPSDHPHPDLPLSRGKELPGQYGPPPVPGQTSPGVIQRGGSRGSDYETVIYIDPASKAVKSVGEMFTVRVRIDNGSNVFAVPFDINYDPNVLEVTGLHEGSYLKKDGGQATFLTSIDRDRGKITIGLTRLGRIGGVSGSGTLMSIDFRALRSGRTSLSLASGKPMDSDLNALPVKFARGEVTVE